MNPLFPSHFKTFPLAIFKPFVTHSHWFCLVFFPQIRLLHSTESTPLLITTVLVILLKNKMKFVLWQEPFAMKSADCCSIPCPLSISFSAGTNHFTLPGSGAMLDEPAWNFVDLPESHSSNIDSVLFFFLEMVSWAVYKLSHSHLVWEQPSEEAALQRMTHMSSRLAGFKMGVVPLMFFLKLLG